MIYINYNDDGFINFVNENDEYHRIGGPAVIEGNKKMWYIEGIKYSESVYHNKLKEMGLL